MGSLAVCRTGTVSTCSGRRVLDSCHTGLLFLRCFGWLTVDRCRASLLAISELPRLRSSELAGTFGRVLECWDRKCKEYVAIKIVRNVQKYRDAAMIEVRPFLSHKVDSRQSDSCPFYSQESRS